LVAEDREMDTLASGAVVMPRALVAISEDRQWLVVLEDVFSNGGAWVIYRDAEDDVKRPWVLEAWRDDTGQSAESVLAGWLEGRDG
jgi:hypothetical protein